MKKLFRGTVEKCKVVLLDQGGYNLLVASLNGKDIEITLGKPSKQRSNQENRYYWGVVIKLISEHTGYTADEAHDAMRLKFLRNNDGKLITLKSTTKLSTVEFEAYMSSIRQFASEPIDGLDFYIPEPGEITDY